MKSLEITAKVCYSRTIPRRAEKEPANKSHALRERSPLDGLAGGERERKGGSGSILPWQLFLLRERSTLALHLKSLFRPTLGADTRH
ncbi:MAG TPA: hypothetical protein VMY43_06265 [Methanothrix sp.]|nr:hypothetical protein [Methanothrix sp.]